MATVQESHVNGNVDTSKALPVVFRILEKWQCNSLLLRVLGGE